MLRKLFSQWIATIYVAVVSAAVTFLLARSLGPNFFGIYSYFLALTSLIAAIQDGGFNALLVREKTTASPHLKFLVVHLPSYALGNNLIVTAVAVLTICLLPTPNKPILLASVFCFSLIALSQTVSAIFKGEGQFGRDAVWQISFRSVTAITIILAAVIAPLSPLIIFLSWAVGAALVIAVGSGRVLVFPKIPNYRVMYWEILPLAVIGLATSIYFKIDIVMLAYLLDDVSQAGYYSAAYKLIEGFIFLLAPVCYICFQILRKNWQDNARFAELLKWMTGLMLIAALAAILVLGWLGPWVIELAYGESYETSAELLFWLSLALFFVMPNYILTQAAIANNKSGLYAWITVVTSIGNVSMNLYLIPQYGAVGAAWATIASEALMFGLLLAVFRKYFFSGHAGINFKRMKIGK
jgi:O-antigen/teichoic acid export membrane protein